MSILGISSRVAGAPLGGGAGTGVGRVAVTVGTTTASPFDPPPPNPPLATTNTRPAPTSADARGARKSSARLDTFTPKSRMEPSLPPTQKPCSSPKDITDSGQS